MTMTNPCRGVMFDLDGTLADTLADIADAGNHMLAHFGLEPQPIERFRYLAGKGVHWLVEEGTGFLGDTARIEEGVTVFRKRYADEGHRYTKPYPGVPELLDALVERGVPIAVLSNKPDFATQHVIATVFARWKFAVVRGAREDTPLKPDPTAARLISDEVGIALADWAYLGDTDVDMLTAKAAGMFGVGVLWGFRDEPELREAGADLILAEAPALLERIRFS